MSRRFIAATLSYVALSLMWAYPWHMLWFHDVYVDMGAVTRGEPIIVLGLLSLVIQGVVISYLYPRVYRERRKLVHGVQFTFIVGSLIYSVMAFATAAKFAIAPVPQFLVYHTVFQAIQFLLTGTVLGYIYRFRAPGAV